MLKKLKDECYIVMGQSPSSEFYNQTREGIPFLQGRKTFGDKYPTIDTWTTKPSKIGSKNSVLMSVRAPVGDVNIAPFDICIGRGLASIKMKNNHNQYLYYLLKNNIEKIKNKSSGTVFDAINRNDLENLVLNFNDEIEQIKIEKILSNIDKKIELNNKINNNLFELNKTIYKENIECLKSDYPKDYFKTIGEVTILNSRGISPSYVVDNEGISVINQSCIRNNVIQEEKIQYHDHKKKVDLKYYYNEYDILINSMGVGTLGRISQIGKLNKPYLIHSCISIIRADETKINQFILGQQLINMQQDIENMAQGTTGQTSLSNKELDKKIIFIPPLEAQNKIAPILKYNIDMISANLIENTKLSQLRDTLLPKLMNGEIDLDSIEV